MIVAVLLFARAKDLAGTDCVRVVLPVGATVAQLRLQLGQTIPALGGLLDRSAIAVNDEFADPVTRLKEQDVVALLPPASGG
jgi:molybdopterin converting factor small subunit